MLKESYIKDYTQVFTIRGDEIEITAPALFDSQSNELLYDKDLDDSAIEMANEQYRQKHNFISSNQIKELRKRIGIGGRDFATLMGWSPTTIVMYENGALPTKNNSDQLKRIYENPETISSYYHGKEHLLNEKVRNKIEAYLNEINTIESTSRSDRDLSVLEVAKYISSKKERLTTMKLQKLVYYCQAWSLAKHDIPLFPEDFQAWPNGPVCFELFRKHKGDFMLPHGFLNDVESKQFSPEQLEIMDGVLLHYGGKPPEILSKMTHDELPWNEARGNLPAGAKCSTIINKETMQLYYGGLFYAGLFPSTD